MFVCYHQLISTKVKVQLRLKGMLLDLKLMMADDDGWIRSGLNGHFRYHKTENEVRPVEESVLNATAVGSACRGFSDEGIFNAFIT